jgi:hypothetical protein
METQQPGNCHYVNLCSELLFLHFVYRPEFKYVSEIGSVYVFTRGEGDTYSAGSLRSIEFTGPGTQQNVFLLNLRTETDSVSETLCFIEFRNPDDGQSPEAQ